MSLFERWLEIERATGRPMTEILADINAACGTKYKHNWPSDMQSRGFGMERTPSAVRRYMLEKVLPEVVDEYVSRGKIVDMGSMIKSLT